MGLFSFLGKAIGTVAKVGLGIATGNIGGAIATGAQSLGLLHGAKAPMSGTPLKTALLLRVRNPQLLRGNQTQSMPGGVRVNGIAGSTRVLNTNARILRASPVLPGGAVATPSGPAPQSAAAPPTVYRGGGAKRKKHRSASSRRSSTKRSGKKRSGGGKLKFGSPAWRKKYMKRGSKRRRKS